MRPLLILSLIIFSSAFISPIIAQQDDFIKQYVERLENSRTYLVLVAEQMPEDKYAYRATPESKTFAENLMHIGWAMDWHSQSLLGGRKARDWQTDMELRVGTKSKSEMIQKINDTFSASIALITQFNVSKLNDELDYLGLNRTKRQILLLLADHITHHRAQMIVYLRLNEIQPPRYILYQ